jgi:sigma-B regulation protein RsbU (phosphoserine phosphatase)
MQPDFDLVRTVDGLNTLLCRNTKDSTFVTMFLGELDCASRRLRYVRAGHDFPILVSADGSARTLEAGGCFLGMFPGTQFSVEEIRMEPGDVLCLYTDGVTEARNRHDEEFGLERLVGVLKAHHHALAESLGLAVRRSVEEFSGLMVQADDMTLLIARLDEEGCRGGSSMTSSTPIVRTDTRVA